MKQKFKLFVPVFLVVLDFFGILGAFYLTFELRYGFDVPEINFQPFTECYPALGLLFCIAMAFSGVFGKRFRTSWEVITKVFCGVVGGVLLCVVFLYVFRSKWSVFPSSVLLLVIPVSSFIISLVNLVFLRRLKLLKIYLVVVGGKEKEQLFINRSRIKIVRVESIEDILNVKLIDEILICNHIHSDAQLNLLIFLLNKLKVSVYFSPGLYAELLSNKIEKSNSLKFLAASIGTKKDIEEFAITLLDTVGSLVLLIVSSPILAVISAVIKITSSGPVFYKQERVGKDGVGFIMYKFRTMVEDAEKKTGPVLAEESDSRITPVGSFLRRTRIDELPQLLNVLKGQMSLVGPRPEREHFVKLHKALRGIRLAVKPGLTGLAQIKNAYDLHPQHKIKYDYLYIQRRSFLLNIYILFYTIPVVLGKKGR